MSSSSTLILEIIMELDRFYHFPSSVSVPFDAYMTFFTGHPPVHSASKFLIVHVSVVHKNFLTIFFGGFLIDSSVPRVPDISVLLVLLALLHVDLYKFIVIHFSPPSSFTDCANYCTEYLSFETIHNFNIFSC